MLYSIVDDRSGVCYQEYHCVYGEDVEAALRFLFNALFRGQLDPARSALAFGNAKGERSSASLSRELQEQMLAAGLPL
jgi:hypothetical protein